MFGLHPNAEIGYLTNLGETLFATILSCSGGSGGGGGSKKDSIAKDLIDRFLGILPPEFIMLDLYVKAKGLASTMQGSYPYIVVCLQECERMNILTGTIKKTLEDLNAGLAG